MPVSPRGRYQRREPVEQLVRGEQHADFAARSGFLALVDEMFRVELTQPFLGKGGSGAVAQETLQSLPVMGFDTHAGIEREAAVMLTGNHGLAFGLVQQSAPHEKADDALADRSLQVHHLFGCEVRFLKVQVSGLFFTEHTVDHQHMEMQVGIEQTAEAVDEDDGTDVCVDLRCAVCFGQAFPQTLFDAVQEAVQHGVLQLGVVEMVA